eukprot:TRINITY_DN3237_c0_g1_i1.p1 TRINITY_DN3237_c0_g1~~TRINITY_DN3237_c0_g1_i1.p1  ORF type:complete len:451 (-),score=46.20 TRINITY_DN3237_c0_g1_i1:96-1448(-)
MSLLRSALSLPDLRDRIAAAGTLPEYTRYRARYLAWRQGSHIGAAGEITDLSVSSGRTHGHWHPTPQQFFFFIAISYWIVISGIVAAALLFFAFVAPLIGRETLPITFVNILVGMGNAFFTLNLYLVYLQVINVPESTDETMVYLWADWQKVRERVSLESLVCAPAYLIGILFTDFAFVMILTLEPSPETNVVASVFLDKVPNLLGGIGFTIGGICEVLHGCHMASEPLQLYCSIITCFGDVCFLASTVLGAVPNPPAMFGELTSIVLGFGCAAFWISSCLQLKIWRSNNFGLLIINQLNNVLQFGGHVSLTAREGGIHVGGTTVELDESHSTSKTNLSLRGILFLAMYAWALSMGCMNLASSLCCTESYRRRPLDSLNNLWWLLVVFIVLVVHSGVTSLPNKQPYRCAFLSLRVALLILAVSQTIMFADFFLGLSLFGEFATAELHRSD